MGPRRRDARRLPLTLIARVVPDLPTFAVDDGFAYEVPDTMSLEVGAIVRVPLSGRRVRGWVIALEEGERSGLKRVLGRSGDLAVFDERLLRTLRWVAAHYVAPLAAVLGKPTPPNLPKARELSEAPDVADLGSSPLPEVSAAAAKGSRTRTHAWLGPTTAPDELAALVAPVVGAGRSAVLVFPTAVEAEEAAAALMRVLPGRVVVGGSSRSAKDMTKAWVEAASTGGRVVLGTRDVAFWPIRDLALAVVVGEGRRGMKDKATPTTHAREVLHRRSAVERFSLVVTDLVPSGETISRGAVVVSSGSARPWGLIDIVDRAEDPPGGGSLAERTRMAISSVVRDGGRVAVFTHRRRAALRCVQCRTLRTCSSCGARPGDGDVCERCGAATGPCTACGGRRFEALGAPVGRLVADIGRFLGPERVGEVDDDRPVAVVTERDLPALGAVDLAVVVDADGLILAPHYRAPEDALRLMARVVAAAGRSRGRRGIVQTADPSSPVLEALRRADPDGFMQQELESRAGMGFPPAGELIALEVQGMPSVHDALAGALGDRATVLGPSERDGRMRWLLQGRDLGAARIVLRGLVHEWREHGARVRVDADPIDL